LMCTKEKKKMRERSSKTHKAIFPKAKPDIMTVSLSTHIAYIYIYIYI
jgi:hypothetical protein